jgi:hypothetical protein
MHILKHPAFTPVNGNALHGCVDGVPSGYISHSGMSEAGVAGLKLGNGSVDFALERFWFGASQNLIPPAPSQSIPIHSIHARIEMFGLHQAADSV